MASAHYSSIGELNFSIPLSGGKSVHFPLALLQEVNGIDSGKHTGFHGTLCKSFP